MVRELARIDVGQAGEVFEAAVADAGVLFEEAPGCHGMTLHRSIEHPGRYWLIVEWRSVADHEAFRASPAFAKWRALAGPHFVTPPTVEHLDQVAG